MYPPKLGQFTVRPRLTEIRKSLGLTQQQLSEMSGVPQGSISRFDANSRHEDAHVIAIMRALDVSYEDLFEVIPESTGGE